MKELYNNAQIKESVERQLLWLDRQLEPREPIWMIGILNGAFRYMADLSEQIDRPVIIDFLAVESYKGKIKGEVILRCEPKKAHKNMTIVLVDDIFDTGETIFNVAGYLEKYMPKRILMMTAFYRSPMTYFSDMIHPGLPVYNNDFVVGYGLDNNEFDRDLNSLYKI